MVQVYLECLIGLNVQVTGSYLFIRDDCFKKKSFSAFMMEFSSVLHFVPPTEREEQTGLAQPILG